MINFFNIKSNWSIRELALLKICMLSTGISLGIYFASALQQQLLLFCMIAGFTAVSILFLWIIKTKTYPKKK